MHARDEAELDVRGLGQLELLDLLAGHLHELVVVHVPELVALEAEVLHADRGVALVGHHPRAPGLEVLDAQDLHAGLVDVDPVVREQILALDHQQHGEELAVAQAAGGVADIHRRLRLGDADRRAQRQRGDHVGGRQNLAAGVHLDDLAVAESVTSLVTGAFMRISPPCSWMSLAICSHIWPGPKRG